MPSDCSGGSCPSDIPEFAFDEGDPHLKLLQTKAKLQKAPLHSHSESQNDGSHSAGQCEQPELEGHLTDTPDFPVDVVYTWVKQPTEKEYEAVAKDCPDLKGGWQRFRDLNTFQFSFRLLEKHLPWVRKIFVVTPGEVPGWLDTSNPRVQMVNQDDIWLQSRLHEDKPIHNSQSVEAHLHRIPGLSTHFIYLNDDMFVGRPLDRSFFFTDTGKPVIHANANVKKPDLHWCSAWQPGSMPMSKETHTYSSLTIPMIEDIQKRWPTTFAWISGAHCRGELSPAMGPTWLYGWYGIHAGLSEVHKPGKMSWLADTTGTDAKRSQWYADLLSDPPDIGCINDDFDVNDKKRFVHEKNALLSFMHEFAEREDETPSSSVKQGQWCLLELSEGHGLTVRKVGTAKARLQRNAASTLGQRSK